MKCACVKDIPISPHQEWSGGNDPNNVKRAHHLRNLATTTKTLIAQGEQDSFLGRRGMASIQDLVNRLKDTTHHALTLVCANSKMWNDVSQKAVPQVCQAIGDFAVGLLDEKKYSKDD
eukprot:CAMPEP_0202497590 /NCGR_PEP_ID=MMETSP1361-20130828/23276_1 /ASSEMBLY_ACC=CAM_ASM_000849 /TAXON_ID=210615 /ORGANISM="Staurosira complex sp., Strain CCMP2646" /LENGTH=117 /DNA_ID=CAMNT_0049129237 /DNA_START=432 /DNA_END=784 /DNA_ORIENTATION=+